MLPDQHLKKDLLFHSHRQSKHILGDILEPQDRLSSKFCHICPKWAQEISQPYGKYNEFISADHRALTVGDENCRQKQWMKIVLDFFMLVYTCFHFNLLLFLHFGMHFEIKCPIVYIFPPNWVNATNQPTDTSQFFSILKGKSKLKMQYPVSTLARKADARQNLQTG